VPSFRTNILVSWRARTWWRGEERKPGSPPVGPTHSLPATAPGRPHRVGQDDIHPSLCEQPKGNVFSLTCPC